MSERPELPPRTWPEERYPLPAEWVAWYDAADDGQRLEIARRFIAWHQEANRCFNNDHMGRLSELEGLLDAFTDSSRRFVINRTPTPCSHGVDPARCVEHRVTGDLFATTDEEQAQ